MAHKLVGCLFRDRFTALVAVGNTNRREEQAEIIVNFGDRAYGRPRASRRRLLFDRDRRRQPFDSVDVGRFKSIEKLPRIRRERLHIAALSFGINRIEGQTRFSRAAEARDDGELIPGYFDVDAFEVVLPRSADGNALNGAMLHSTEFGPDANPSFYRITPSIPSGLTGRHKESLTQV